jgi:hypothetical protein
LELFQRGLQVLVFTEIWKNQIRNSREGKKKRNWKFFIGLQVLHSPIVLKKLTLEIPGRRKKKKIFKRCRRSGKLKMEITGQKKRNLDQN